MGAVCIKKKLLRGEQYEKAFDTDCSTGRGGIAHIGSNNDRASGNRRRSLVFTKGGFIVGVGGGHGVLTFRGRNYPFRVSGISFGATIGASTNQLVGRALNIHSPGDIAGTYSAIGAGGALAGGAGGVQLQNSNGVILQLRGAKVGVELSAAVSGVQIALE
jgi:hypothetical protein